MLLLAELLAPGPRFIALVPVFLRIVSNAGGSGSLRWSGKAMRSIACTGTCETRRSASASPASVLGQQTPPLWP